MENNHCNPPSKYSHILLGHGGGGKLMNQLLNEVFFKTFCCKNRHDGAILELDKNRIAFTTDSYVVDPIFFPGGDIGSLAVYGTVNDLAMCGARPLFLSTSFILEEGLEIATLTKIAHSMQKAAIEAKVELVTGDTKVVNKGKGHQVFINTSGIGIVEHNLNIAPQSICPGDKVLLSGDLGRHGIAIMAQREGLEFESTIKSDCANLSHLVMELIKANIEMHCLRDLTRGGLTSALVEIAQTAKNNIYIKAKDIPVCQQVQGACELLGLDPLYVANEGRFICILASSQAQKALEIMQSHPLGREARCIGEVQKEMSEKVIIQSKIGVNRVLNMLSGEQLPRIC